jgi:hypothetical protein
MGHESNDLGEQKKINAPLFKVERMRTYKQGQKKFKWKAPKGSKVETRAQVKRIKLSLGVTTKDHLKEWLIDNQKWPNHFPRPCLSKTKTTFFSHVYPLCALIYGLNFSLE